MSLITYSFVGRYVLTNFLSLHNHTISISNTFKTYIQAMHTTYSLTSIYSHTYSTKITFTQVIRQITYSVLTYSAYSYIKITIYAFIRTNTHIT